MNFLRFILIASLLLPFSCRKTPEYSDRATASYAQYLTGVNLLQVGRAVPRFDRQAVCLEQLQQLTGIDRDSMITFLTALKDHPEKGFKLYDAMKQLDIQKKDTVSQSNK